MNQTQEPADGDKSADGQQTTEPEAGHEPCHPAFPRHDRLSLVVR
ncbi:hypothetical protein [Sphaerisporangium fuscum]|nr:hypothetical protein [Sphaerisporangium fuscum]